MGFFKSLEYNLGGDEILGRFDLHPGIGGKAIIKVKQEYRTLKRYVATNFSLSENKYYEIEEFLTFVDETIAKLQQTAHEIRQIADVTSAGQKPKNDVGSD